MRPPVFAQAGLVTIRAATTGPCAKCEQEIAPGTLWKCDTKGEPVHIGPCPTPGPFAEARAERGLWP